LLKLLKQRIRQSRLQRERVLDEPARQSLPLGNWVVLPELVLADSVIYSFGVGANVAWDVSMIERFGCLVHAFDPTPASRAWVAEQALPSEFRFYPWGISSFNGQLPFFPPRKAGGMHFSQDRLHGRANRPPVLGDVFRLETIMRRLGHTRIDVLKLDVEGSEFDCLPDIMAADIPIEQLLVEIHYQFRTRSFRSGMDLIQRLKAWGLSCYWVSPRGYEFAFVRDRTRG
jgi:FkbM family methyltransferase